MDIPSTDTEQMLKKLSKDNLEKLEQNAKELSDIWNLVGVDQEQQLSRANQAWSWIINLSNELVTEEKGFYEDVKERVKNYEHKIADLSQELLVPEFKAKGTLIEKEEMLRQELDKLSKLKHKRIKEYQELYSLELKYCKMLGMSQHSISSTTGVPSEKDLFELRQQLNMLQVEKEKRFDKFLAMKKELVAIWEITELAPETAFEKDILKGNACPSLTKDSLDTLEQCLVKVKNKKADLECERKNLLDKLSALWARLNIEDSERQIFLSRHNECKVSNINAFKEEIARCEEIKTQHLKQYIDGLKKELVELWVNCFVPDSAKVFPNLGTEEINEEVVKNYESEVANWRQYYDTFKHIIEKIQKRNNLWDLLIDFENKASDPNRFKNRRGNLLQEERDRKKLQNDLPKLENEIIEAIEEYEFEHKKLFLYQGIDFRNFITKQWQERIQEKENKKVSRKQIKNEMTLSGTPSKRLFPSTPKSAPSKLFKSNHGLPSTPKYNVSKSYAKPVTELKVKKRTPLKTSVTDSIKRVLAEKKSNMQIRSRKKSDETTYSHFAENLDKSSRKLLRSSVLSSKKAVGTRASNLSKRKSGNRSRASISKRACTSRNLVTPSKGKLGIPFLI